MEINVNPFSKASIAQAIKQLEDYKRELEELNQPTNKVKTAIIDKGVDLAQQKAPTVSREDGSMLAMPIHGTEDGVVAGGDAYFVEFGTGIVGEQSPHPSPEWLAALSSASTPYNKGYNTGKHIVHGDKPHPETGYPDYWVYDKGQHVTSGIPATPFLYETPQELKENLTEIVKDALIGKGQNE